MSSTVDLLGAGGNGPGSDPITVQWLWNTLSNGVVHPGVAATVNVVAGSGIVVVPNEPPVADAGPDQGIILGETVTLDGSGSSDPDNNIDTYDWDFGDSAVGSGMIVTHTYTAPGTYEAVLTVTDTDGLSDSDTAVVVVKSPEEAVDDLIDDIEDLPIHPGTINSLTSKLENVLAKIENGQKKAALNQLNAFINQVEAQRGNKLTDAQADALIAAAEAIRTAVIASCPPAASLTLLDTRTPNALTLTSRPNPFQGATTVRFRLALDGAAQLAIYDVTGGRVRTLVDSWLAAGEHTVSWDGRNSGGQAVAAGVYYYRLVSGTTQATQRIVRLP